VALLDEWLPGSDVRARYERPVAADFSAGIRRRWLAAAERALT